MKDRLGVRNAPVKHLRPMLLIAIIVVVFSGCTSLPIRSDNARRIDRVKDGPSVDLRAKEAPPTPTASERTAAHTYGPPAPPAPAPDDVTAIALGDTIRVSGSGASVEGRSVRITAGGTYSIRGKLKNGQIIVDTNEKKTVELVLSGVDITYASGPPIYVMRAKTTVIVLADGTANRITDGDSYDIEDAETNEPNAAIFSKGNLTFQGNGSLTVQANYRNGISSKDELNITGGNITVNAANDGIRGRDYIAIKDGNINVTARADGLESNDEEATEWGFVSIEGGTISVTAGQDGIQAATSVVIKGGTINVSSGGGSAGHSPGDSSTPDRSTASSSSVSAKGIKAVSDVKIQGGTIVVDSSDDAIHSNDSITIEGGTLVLASGDQGIHSDSTLTISGGDTRITRVMRLLKAQSLR